MTVNGLPLHPLVVHAAVVFACVAPLVAIAYAVVPTWRNYLRWPLLVLAVLAAALVWFAADTGSSLENSTTIRSAMQVNPALAHAIHHHEDLAGKLQAIDWLAAAVAALTWWFHNRPGWMRNVVLIVLALVAIGSLVLVILTGDAGARAVWNP